MPSPDTLSIAAGRLEGCLSVPTSKSFAHRAYILAALSPKACRIKTATGCTDMEVTLNCLRQLGVNVCSHSSTEHSISKASAPHAPILPISTNSEANTKASNNTYTEIGAKTNAYPSQLPTLDCKDSGSSLRFILPLACALNIPCRIQRSKQLSQRPLRPLIDALKSCGAIITCDKHYSQTIIVKQGLAPNVAWDFKLDPSQSSQYLTGLLLGLASNPYGGSVELTAKLPSQGYIDITKQVLRDFGLNLYANKNKFHLTGTLTPPEHLNLEADWSQAATWLCAGALGTNKIRLCGLNPHSVQGDAAIIDILKGFGCSLHTTDSKLWMSAPADGLKAYNFSAQHTPDIIPAISLVAAQAHGTTHISHCERLRLKESDRLAATITNLNRLGVDTKLQSDTLIIHGLAGEAFKSAALEGMHDHRMIMQAALAASCSTGTISINHAQGLEKSYPHFLSHLQLLQA